MKTRLRNWVAALGLFFALQVVWFFVTVYWLVPAFGFGSSTAFFVGIFYGVMTGTVSWYTFGELENRRDHRERKAQVERLQIERNLWRLR